MLKDVSLIKCAGRLSIGVSAVVTLFAVGFAPTATAESRSAAVNATPVVAKTAGIEVRAADVQAAVTGLPPDRMAGFQEKQANAEALAKDLLIRRVIAQRAEKEGLARNSAVVARVKLAQERALFEIYLEELEKKAVADDKAIERVAREEYLAFPERYKDDGYQVRHILIRPQPSCERDARGVAEALLARLKAGEAFATLAEKYSDDTGSAKKGGDLGRVTVGKTVKPFEEAMLALKKPGELSPVIETQFGFHILQLDALPSGKLAPFDEVKAPLMEAIRAKRRAEARRAFVEPLVDPANIAIEAEALRKALNGTWP